MTEEDEEFLRVYELAYSRGYKKGWRHAYLLWLLVVAAYVLAQLLLIP